ncbi:protein NEDD1 [Lates japonicus]|uniref:Protein NEDD1 n=1 Tax=Lates japonicus TaxID=270547 RepID=A0AAD3NJV8_LATJO|nr:protein NEDD1 [Lates japonicus]
MTKRGSTSSHLSSQDCVSVPGAAMERTFEVSDHKECVSTPTIAISPLRPTSEIWFSSLTTNLSSKPSPRQPAHLMHLRLSMLKRPCWAANTGRHLWSWDPTPRRSSMLSASLPRLRLASPPRPEVESQVDSPSDISGLTDGRPEERTTGETPELTAFTVSTGVALSDAAGSEPQPGKLCVSIVTVFQISIQRRRVSRSSVGFDIFSPAREDFHQVPTHQKTPWELLCGLYVVDAQPGQRPSRPQRIKEEELVTAAAAEPCDPRKPAPPHSGAQPSQSHGIQAQLSYDYLSTGSASAAAVKCSDAVRAGRDATETSQLQNEIHYLIEKYSVNVVSGGDLKLKEEKLRLSNGHH